MHATVHSIGLINIFLVIIIATTLFGRGDQYVL